MHKIFIKITLLILFCLPVSEIQAQKPNLKFKSIKASDGLINSTVGAIFEDSYGFIWLSTQHGVQRYDGTSYTDFTSESNDTTGLSHNHITGFCEDSKGDIWIATAIGLNRYSRGHDKVFHYRWKGEDGISYDDIQIFRIVYDEEAESLWMLAKDVGLIKLNIGTNEVQRFDIPTTGVAYVLSLYDTDRYPNHLLIGTSNLFLLNRITGELSRVFSLKQTDDFHTNRFNDLLIDPTNSDIIWAATGDIWGRGTFGGLLKYNLATGESKLYTRNNRPGEIPDWHILTICFSEPDKMWVGTRNFGVLLYDLNEDLFYNYRYNEYDEGSLVTENAIRSMHLDRSGTLWLGTWGDGISLLSPTRQKFTHYKHLPNLKGGLSSNWITSITEDKDGNVWLGTKADGLSEFDPVKRTFKNHFSEFALAANPVEITYVFYDSRENLWIGTFGNALYRYNPVTGKKIHYPKGITNHTVSQKRISAISEPEPGEVLISTYGGGLNIYDYDTDTFSRYLHDPNDPTSIPDNQIWLPIKGDDGNYYMSGNSSGGLIRFNPQTKQFSEPLPRPAFSTFLSSATDSRGRIFIDALSEGWSQLHFEDSIYVRPLTDQSGNNIIGGESAAIDLQDNVWIGTTNGLLKYNAETKELKRYGPDEGLQGYDFYRFAAYRSSTGTMYFGGLNGLNTFNPEDISLSEYEPPVVLTGFKLFQEDVQIGEDSPLQNSILVTDKIELRHKENDFSISFSGLDFSNPHKIQYHYQLVNHDEEWVDAGNFTTAGYTNMDPGSYTFKVKSTNADGVWNDSITSLEIIIKPPWWETKAAYAGYLLIFILGIILVDRYQKRRFKEKEQAQARERELAQAKEIEKAYNKLETAHENLKTTQSQLIQSEKMASLGELTAGIAHEIQNPLNFVNNFSEVNSELISEMNEEIEKGNIDEIRALAADLNQNEQKIAHHGKRADSIVKGMLQHSRTGSGQKELTDINSLADEYLRLSYHGLRAKDKSFNADFRLELDDQLPKVNILPQDIGRVLLNLINNAFFAVNDRLKENIEGYKPEVVLMTKLSGEHVEIHVKDNGMGIPDEIKDKIFQPFFTTKSTGEGTGLGLSLSYDIITKGHGGKLQLETEVGHFTKFKIVLPTNNIKS